jgi:hypothetical protein
LGKNRNTRNKNTDDVLVLAGKLNVLRLVSYARMQGQRRRGVQTDVTRD